MLATKPGRVTWYPVARAIFTLLLLFLATAGLSAGQLGGAAFFGVGALAGMAATVVAWRDTRRDADVAVIRSWKGTTRVPLRRASVGMDRHYRGEAASISVAVGPADHRVPVIAKVTPTGAPMFVRMGTKVAEALDVPFDADGWNRWLTGHSPNPPD